MGIGGWVGRRGLVGAAGWSDKRLDMWAAVSIGGGELHWVRGGDLQWELGVG